MKINFLGDVHARYITDFRPNTIQLGDFHLHGYELFYDKFGMKRRLDFPFPFYFVEGNHDNYPKLRIEDSQFQEMVPNLFHIPRGFISGKVLFIGGADSTDKNNRIEGYEWYPEERITYGQINRILNQNKKIEVVVSHDAPQVYVKRVFGDIGFIDSSAIILNNILEILKPQLWIHAHFHQSKDTTFKDCRFISVNIREYKKIDVPVNELDFIRIADSL
jgi:Icc-related predicted phosphoesterase